MERLEEFSARPKEFEELKSDGVSVRGDSNHSFKENSNTHIKTNIKTI